MVRIGASARVFCSILILLTRTTVETRIGLARVVVQLSMQPSTFFGLFQCSSLRIIVAGPMVVGTVIVDVLNEYSTQSSYIIIRALADICSGVTSSSILTSTICNTAVVHSCKKTEAKVTEFIEYVG